jgi:hypothetical protein
MWTVEEPRSVSPKFSSFFLFFFFFFFLPRGMLTWCADVACWCGDKNWCGSTERRHVARACARSVAVCTSHMLASGEGGRSLTGAWGHVQPPMEAFPPQNGRSSSKEFGSGASFLNRSWEAPVLGFERCGGAGAREHCLRHFLRRVEARYFFDGGFSTVQR